MGVLRKLWFLETIPSPEAEKVLGLESGRQISVRLGIVGPCRMNEGMRSVTKQRKVTTSVINTFSKVVHLYDPKMQNFNGLKKTQFQFSFKIVLSYF